jgi:hypothetical protein
MGVVAGAALGEALAEAQPVGVYRPRQPRASPLYRLLDEHFQTFATVYDERFAPRWRPWWRVVAEVVEKFLTPVEPPNGFGFLLSTIMPTPGREVQAEWPDPRRPLGQQQTLVRHRPRDGRKAGSGRATP